MNVRNLTKVTHTRSQHTHNTWKHSGNTLAAWRRSNPWKTRRGEVVFIGPEKQGTFGQGAYVWYLYTLVQRLLRTSRYYLEGIPKSNIRPVHYKNHTHFLGNFFDVFGLLKCQKRFWRDFFWRFSNLKKSPVKKVEILTWWIVTRQNFLTCNCLER